jgi:type I restriction enzyme S subunit
MKDIRAFKIYNLPTLKEQEKVVIGIDNISAETKNLEAIYQQKIEELEALKKTVLNKAFKGEL